MDACHPQPAEVPAPKLTLPGCPLCDAYGGHMVVRLPVCRVIRADELGFPALYRVVLNEHVAEWSDVSDADQADVMRVVNTVERVMREQLHPTKINLAALGNMVPHVHWHVIARFDWDSHFPAPIWAQPQRAVEPGQISVVSQLLPRVDDVLRQRLLPS
jgi:diadenosine tetraphosphate (Ap4A) HIT family hydrolase